MLDMFKVYLTIHDAARIVVDMLMYIQYEKDGSSMEKRVFTKAFFEDMWPYVDWSTHEVRSIFQHMVDENILHRGGMRYTTGNIKWDDGNFIILFENNF